MILVQANRLPAGTLAAGAAGTAQRGWSPVARGGSHSSPRFYQGFPVPQRGSSYPKVERRRTLGTKAETRNEELETRKLMVDSMRPRRSEVLEVPSPPHRVVRKIVITVDSPLD